MWMTFLILILLCCLPYASAQTAADAGYVYVENNPDNMILYNGRIYQSPYFNDKNHPFLDVNTWMKGSISIKEQIFNPVSLKYDIIDDQIVMNLSLISTAVSIQPATERINSFSLGSRNFVRLTTNDYPECQTGFYEVKCPGILTFYIRHQKQSPKTDGGTDIWSTSEYYFLGYKDQITLIKKRTDLMKFFSHNNEMLEYIQKQHIPYKITNSEILIQLCNHMNKWYTEK